MLSEEEIIEIIKEFLELREIYSKNSLLTKSYLELYQEAIQGLLDLYEKEKEKNKRIKDGILLVGRRSGKSNELKVVLEEYISKDKIREKIEELKKEYKQFLDQDREDDCMITREEIDILEELLEESNMCE